MTFTEYKEKYQTIEQEYNSVEPSAWRDKINSNESNLNPIADPYWINYARDQKFDFRLIHFPRKDDSWYDDFHNKFDMYESGITLWKDFFVAESRWTLDIQLDGTYLIYDSYGVIIVDPTDANNEYVITYNLPKYIGTVCDLMKVLDVIEMHKHDKGEASL